MSEKLNSTASAACVAVGQKMRLHDGLFRNERTLERSTNGLDLITSNYQPFPALKLNLGGHKFKDNGEMETVVT
jgi:hypothetical protein